jgi:DNA recombination-dependent growth factor C
LITTGAGFYYAGINMFVEDVKDLIDATGAESDVSEDTMEILVKVLNSLPAVALFAASMFLFVFFLVI